MADSMMMRNGYLKFMRLGPVKFGPQDRWANAPERHGLWAFPYPFFDFFFAYHKYTDLLPKRLRSETINALHEDDDRRIDLWAEQSAWVKNVGRKILPMRETWYRGDVYTHFAPNGEITSDWHRMNVHLLHKAIQSSGGQRQVVQDREGRLIAWPSGVDHLEIFIAPKQGDFKDFRNK